MAVLGPIVLSQSLLMMAGKPKMLEGGAVGAHRRPKTTVPGWRERLLCCKCGSREVDKVVTGTERAAGLFGRSPIVHWRYRFTGGGKRIRTRSPTVVFAVGPAERETISIGAAENPTLSEARPTVRIRFPPAASQTNSHAFARPALCCYK